MVETKRNALFSTNQILKQVKFQFFYNFGVYVVFLDETGCET